MRIFHFLIALLVFSGLLLTAGCSSPSPVAGKWQNSIPLGSAGPLLTFDFGQDNHASLTMEYPHESFTGHVAKGTLEGTYRITGNRLECDFKTGDNGRSVREVPAEINDFKGEYQLKGRTLRFNVHGTWLELHRIGANPNLIK